MPTATISSLVFILFVSLNSFAADSKKPSESDTILANQMICATIIVKAYESIGKYSGAVDNQNKIAVQMLENAKGLGDKEEIKRWEKLIDDTKPKYLFSNKKYHDLIEKEIIAFQKDHDSGDYSKEQLEKTQAPKRMLKVLKISQSANPKYYAKCYSLMRKINEQCMGAGDEHQVQMCTRKKSEANKSKLNELSKMIFNSKKT